ncbi:ATP-binding protein [Cytobacillus sp. FJAT-54145]|uniref:histidine kinase n=1 Tax=Cytobacillus spartinae TaxID=3299023 RepID=A0ABW6KGW2_9BACI
MIRRRLLFLLSFLILRIRSSIRVKLLIVFIISIVAGILTNIILFEVLENRNVKKVYSYDHSYNEYEQYMQWVENEVKTRLDTDFNEITKQKPEGLNVFLVNKEGYKYDADEQLTNEQIDIYEYLKIRSENHQEYIYITPVQKHGRSLYLVGQGLLTLSYEEIRIYNEWLGVIGLIVFYIFFYFLTRIKIKQLEKLSKGFTELAEGNLSFRAKVKGKDEISQLAEQMNEMMDKLQTSKEEELRLQQFKTELITNVSHDLRTPLTSVIGYLSLLKDQMDMTNEDKAEYTEIAHKKAEQLSSLVNDLFEFTKLSNRDLPILKEPLSINQLLAQLLDEYEYMFTSHDMHVKKHIPSQNTVIHGDAQKLVRLFENMFRNAMDHGVKPGEIHVKLSVHERNAVIEIKNDSRNTLTKQECENIFERFYKKDESRSTGNGSGLGLAIAKEIVELHQGDIKAHSEDKKVTFIIMLPLSESKN